MTRRWAVLTNKYLYTFKKKQVYSRATEKIDLSACPRIPCGADYILMKPNSIVRKTLSHSKSKTNTREGSSSEQTTSMRRSDCWGTSNLQWCLTQPKRKCTRTSPRAKRQRCFLSCTHALTDSPLTLKN